MNSSGFCTHQFNYREHLFHFIILVRVWCIFCILVTPLPLSIIFQYSALTSCHRNRFLPTLGKDEGTDPQKRLPPSPTPPK